MQFVLDHCGNPEIAAGNISDWRQGIRRVAELPNLACKISGIAAYCKPGEASAATLRPYVEHCLEVFGWDRVVWGSDWPVCRINAALSRSVEITREIIVGESAENQRKLLHANAVRIYGVSKTDPRPLVLIARLPIPPSLPRTLTLHGPCFVFYFLSPLLLTPCRQNVIVPPLIVFS